MPRPDRFSPGEILRYPLNIGVTEPVFTVQPFSIVIQGVENLRSQSLETPPQQHADMARQDRQITDNVTVRREHSTIVAVEKQ